MRNGEYGLGIDVGDGTVSAAVCGVDDGGTTGATALPLGADRVAPAVDGDGRVELVPADGTARTRSLVARVGDAVPLYVGGRPVPAAELVAAAVARVRELAEAHRGRPDSWTVLTVPPSWSGHRRAELARALTAVGLPRFSLVSAAVAAVHHHVTAGDLPEEPTVAVYDLGAGTLDTAVVGPTPDEPLGHRAAPPPPLPWGGRDVDDAVVAHVLGCLQTPDGGDPGWPRALRAACVAAKEALSTATVVQVGVDGCGHGPVRLTREELDEVLAEPVGASAGVLAAAVAAAGLRLEELDAVVLVGGGVRVPLVGEVLSGELGRPLVVGPDPALTPALGAATLAAEAIAVEADAALQQPPAAEPAVGDADAGESLASGAPAPERRTRRRRTRPAPAGATASRPPRRAAHRGNRLGRGVVVAGAAVGLLLTGPAVAGLFDAVVSPAPAGQEATTEDGARDGTGDGTGVIARGSAAVGGGSGAAARAAGTRDGAAPATAAAAGTTTRPSLAAAIATAARSSAPSAPGGSPRSSAAAPAPGTSPPGTPVPPRGAGAPAGDAPTAPSPRPSGPPRVVEEPVDRPPPSSGPPPVPDPLPVTDPTPVRPTPVDPTPPTTETPSEEPTSPAPEEPAGEPPASEPRVPPEPSAEPTAPETSDPTATTESV